MPTMDQVAWANANVTTGGETKPYARGSLLPAPVSPEESAERATLRLIGATRVVEVVYTAEELAEQAQARGETTAAREAAFDVDPAVPLGRQVAGQRPGLPTMSDPSGAPVVIGSEDLRAEHEKAAKAARPAAGKPGGTSSSGPAAAPTARPAASGSGSGSAGSSSSPGSSGSSSGSGSGSGSSGPGAKAK